MTVKTRKKLLGRAADESLRIFGCHFPFPGIGFVNRTSDAPTFRYIPDVWEWQ